MTTDTDTDTATTTEVDAIVDKVFNAVLGGMEMLSIAIGDRLGYYAALAGSPMTSAELASACGTNERYTREWLEQQAVCGYLMASPGHGGSRRYALAAGAAEALADPEAPTTMAPAARMVAAAGAQWNRIVDAARTGSGVGWASYGEDMRESQADMNRPPLLQELPGTWLASGLPEVHARLTSGDPLLVADVGCGGGWASIGLAARYPAITVHAYDVDPASVALARENVERAGLDARVKVREVDIADQPPQESYDLALAVECIHDMPRPVPVLSAMRAMAGTDGVVLIVDEKVADEFTAPGDEVERLMYGFSTLVCLPDCMSGRDSAATGTVIRRSTMERYAREAGFGGLDVLPVEHDLWRFYRLTR